MKTITFLIVLFLATSIHAQKKDIIQGVIRDTENIPLAGVNVYHE